MKLSSKILVGMLIVLVGSILSSNILLKKEYDKVDKTDLYWTYQKVLQQPFKYLKIKGGNITNIAFEQNPDCSVRILKEWARYHGGSINAVVKNDTLFIDFDFVSHDTFEKFWLKQITCVRIFAPGLLFVDGYDTKLQMYKMKQDNYQVSMAGKSSFEVESMQPDLDILNISQKDSSEVVFEMSPEYKAPIISTTNSSVIVVDHSKKAISNEPSNDFTKSNESINVQSLTATIQGYSLLDVGHAQIGALQLNIADSSGIILSGGALKKIK